MRRFAARLFRHVTSPHTLQTMPHQLLEARRGEDDAEFNLLRRGWCLGDETFRRELLAQMHAGIGAEHYGEGGRRPRKRWRNKSSTARISTAAAENARW